jgi:hypothetical protein
MIKLRHRRTELMADFVAEVIGRLWRTVIPSSDDKLHRRWAMMGRQNHEQGPLFYEFRLDEAVPADHLVRKIDAALELSRVYSELAPHYPTLGRLSVDPVLMIRMLIIGYVFGLRSEVRSQLAHLPRFRESRANQSADMAYPPERCRAQAICEAPKSGITFDRKSFAADPRIAKLRWV